VSLGADAKVADLKRELAEQTRVQPKRQKVHRPQPLPHDPAMPRTMLCVACAARWLCVVYRRGLRYGLCDRFVLTATGRRLGSC
jgi:hypothetical protein